MRHAGAPGREGRVSKGSEREAGHLTIRSVLRAIGALLCVQVTGCSAPSTSLSSWPMLAAMMPMEAWESCRTSPLRTKPSGDIVLSVVGAICGASFSRFAISDRVPPSLAAT